MCYEYVNSWDINKETSNLLTESSFSDLKYEGIVNKDYKHS